MEDLSQDNILATRLSSFRKLRPEHLDIPPALFNDTSCALAVDELKKMNNYKTPRDKMICISNCCKIIFNVLTRVNPKEAPSADTFLPVLIFLVMRANPPHLHSNLKYIMEYRNPEKMISESGYFLTNLQSTVMFWTTVDHTGLSIDKQEFEKLINGQYFNDDDEELAVLGTTKKEEESDDDQTIMPDNEPSQDGFEMDEKSNPSDSITATPLFPMTPLSRSERAKEQKVYPHNNLYDYVKSGVREVSTFATVENVNDIKVGDLEKLLSEYKQLHEFFETVTKFVTEKTEDK